MIRRTRDGVARRKLPLFIAAALTVGTLSVVVQAQAATSHKPFGKLDTVIQSGNGIDVRGWAIDPDTHSAIHVDAYIDGHGRRLTADATRADIGRAHPGFGNKHGYTTHFTVAAGKHTVCTYAINTRAGAGHTSLGCRTITVNFNPYGSISTAKQFPGGFTATGWVFDRDLPRPALTAKLTVDGTSTATVTANLSRPDLAKRYPSAGAAHGFSFTVNAAEGTHRVCIVATNIGLGTSAPTGCKNVTLNFSPIGAITSLTQVGGGVRIAGWALDPDTTAKMTVHIWTGSNNIGTATANRAAATHTGHGFAVVVPAGVGSLVAGSHTFCVHGANLGTFGTSRSVACKAITLRFNPLGAFDKVTREGSTHIRVAGWAIDPDVSAPSSVRVTIDGHTAGTSPAGLTRNDVAARHPGYGAKHGFSVVYPTGTGEHRVCVIAVNTQNGTGDTSLGCRIINAVHPIAPSSPGSVKAVGGFGAATVTWTAPLHDGGAPVSRYAVRAWPGGRTVAVGASARKATVGGLASNRRYSFTVAARNVAGYSVARSSAIIRTQTSPPPQTTPAPISTSRYVRNISGSSSTDLNKMRAEGAADAAHNPAGHVYLVLLDIGGQDQARHGVLLSATTRFVSYTNLVRCLDAYVDGYKSKQKPSAPVTIALGTNNDMDVTTSAGSSWARSVVHPVAVHAAGKLGLKIAGANDIEPGFRGTYTQTRAWLSGYLAGTSATFVFNGSADGCAWTATARNCNNGWKMSGLYQLSAGASPSRIVNLPQVYNDTMAAQWKYISLTGIAVRQPKINFGGALTEWTACAQSHGCGSLTGRNAWIQMWHQLQSHPATRTRSLPYSTDLRIDH